MIRFITYALICILVGTIICSFVGKEKHFYKKLLPFIFIVIDIITLIIPNVVNIDLCFKIIYIVLNLTSIGFSVWSCTKHFTKKYKNDLVVIYKNLIEIHKLRDVFDINIAHTSYSSVKEKGNVNDFNIELKDGKNIIYNKMRYIEFIPKQEMSEKELIFLMRQLELNCSAFVVETNCMSRFKEYELAIFKDKQLYNFNDELNYKLIEKAKEDISNGSD